MKFALGVIATVAAATTKKGKADDKIEGIGCKSNMDCKKFEEKHTCSIYVVRSENSKTTNTYCMKDWECDKWTLKIKGDKEDGKMPNAKGESLECKAAALVASMATLLVVASTL